MARLIAKASEQETCGPGYQRLRHDRPAISTRKPVPLLPSPAKPQQQPQAEKTQYYRPRAPIPLR